MRPFAVAVCFSLALPASPAFAAEPASHVGVVDAGSSGTRLHLYKYGADPRTLVDVVEIPTAAQPLASFADAPAGAADRALGAVLGALDRELAARGVPKTRVDLHVLATGGMRLLPRDTAQAIEASVRRTLVETGYRPGKIETISGEMEGFYAWLDVNALLGRLGPGRSPVGIIEVGGASVQIAYPGASGAGAVTGSFGGAAYAVRSLSYLGLGIEQARKSLMQGDGGGACYPDGVVVALPDGGARGAFDARTCADAFARVIAAPLQHAPRGEIQPTSFIALGRPLTGVLSDWRLALDAPAAIAGAARENCRLPWDVFTRTYGDTPYTPYLCANSIYLSTLLFDAKGLGLSARQAVVADKIDGRRPSWTRGAALLLRDAR